MNDPICSGCFGECRDGKQTWYSVYFLRTDGGRTQSRRPRQKNDCTVRAIAAAFDLPYDDAYTLMAEAGRKSHRGLHFRQWADSHPQLKRRSFPAVKGQSRMNPGKFRAAFPEGRWICQTAKHVYAVIDGVVYDLTSPAPDRCIYAAWEVLK